MKICKSSMVKAFSLGKGKVEGKGQGRKESRKEGGKEGIKEGGRERMKKERWKNERKREREGTEREKTKVRGKERGKNGGLRSIVPVFLDPLTASVTSLLLSVHSIVSSVSPRMLSLPPTCQVSLPALKLGDSPSSGDSVPGVFRLVTLISCVLCNKS
jgi:hypothetical protein